jgi:VanZ family protein
VRGERRGRRIGLAGQPRQPGERRRFERTLGEATAVENPTERLGQARRGGGVGPPGGALVNRESEQRFAALRLARAGDQRQVQRAAAVAVAAANLMARLVQGRGEPPRQSAAITNARFAHRLPIPLLAVDLAHRGPNLRIVRDRSERQPAICGHREPGGQEILPGVEIREAAADQTERETPLRGRKHRPHPGIGMGEHDLRLESARCERTRGFQGRFPVAIGPDQALVLGAQAGQIGGAADHQRGLPGCRQLPERLRRELGRRGQPARAKGRIFRGGRRTGREIRRPAGKLRREHSARRPQTGPRRVALARCFDPQSLRQNERFGRREKGRQPLLFGAPSPFLERRRGPQSDRRQGEHRADRDQATGRADRRRGARSRSRRAHDEVAIVTKMSLSSSSGSVHWASVLAGLAVGVLLLLPVPAGPPGWLADRLAEALSSQLDKLFHAGLFFVLAGIWLRSFERLAGWPRPVGTAVLFAAAYGALLEGLQGLSPERATSLADAAANLFGALLFGMVVVRRRRAETT